MNTARAILAIFVTLVFIAFGVFLVVNANTADATEWERWVYVFGAAEAIAFAGIGWMFGREVNRQRAEEAEGQAQKALSQAQSEAEKGAKLAGLVRGAAGASTGRQRLERLGTDKGGDLAPAVNFAAEEYGV